MNSIKDLNTATTVSYNQQSNYNIIASNAGNTTATFDKFTDYTPAKQITVATLTDAYRDLLIDFTFSSTGAANVRYTGNYSNIGVLQISPNTYRVQGIRDVNRYNEAWANVRIRDLGVSGGYDVTVRVQDQVAYNDSFVIGLNVTAAPQINVFGNVVYNEDAPANVVIANLIGSSSATTSYTLKTSSEALYGTMSNATSTGTSVELVGNITVLNNLMTNNTLKFTPPPDLTSNVGNAIKYELRTTSSNIVVDTKFANIQIGNVHGEYTVATTYNEDTLLNNLFLITDADPDGTAIYIGNIQQVSGDIGMWRVGNTFTSSNTVYSYSNTKANINGVLQWYPRQDSTGNVSFVYNQFKTRDGTTVTQADAVSIPLTVNTTHNEYSITTAFNYDEDTPTTMVFDITDTAPYVNNYTVRWRQTVPDPAVVPGQFAINGVAQGLGNAAVIAAQSKGSINTANVYYQPPYDYTGNVTLVYDQWVNSTFYGNIQQANTVAVDLTIANTHAEYTTIGSNANVLIRDRINLAQWSITDIDIPPVFGNRAYTWTLAETTKVGNFWVNGNLMGNSSVSFTGNKTYINNVLSNVSTYWEETANAAYTTAGAITAEPVFSFSLDRNSANVINLAANVISNVSVVVPPTEAYPNTTQWQGGYFVQNNGNVVTIAWPYNAFDNEGSSWDNTTPGSNYVRYSTSTITSIPANTASTGSQGYENTDYLESFAYTNDGNSIQAARLPWITTSPQYSNTQPWYRTYSDWYLPAADEVQFMREQYASRLVFQDTWTSTIQNGNVLYYDTGTASLLQEPYANIRAGTSNVSADIVPMRRVWTTSNYYNIANTNSAVRGVPSVLNNWWVGLPEDGYTYNVNLNCDTGFFLSNNVTKTGNTYVRNSIPGGSTLYSNNVGVRYVSPVEGSTANITISITRNDNFPVLTNLTREISLTAPSLGADWRASQGGFYGGEFASTGSGPTDVYLVYSTEQPAQVWVPSGVNVPMPDINSQFDGPNNTANLYSFDSANSYVIANTVSYSTTLFGTTWDDWYVPSIDEMTTANVKGWSSTVNLDIDDDKPRKVAYKEKLVINGRGNITYQEMYNGTPGETYTPMRRVNKS